eukprot:12006156-Heterocapsa_arctica.AAC.1
MHRSKTLTRSPQTSTSTIACATPSPIGAIDVSGPPWTGRLIDGGRFSTAPSTQRLCAPDAGPREYLPRLHCPPTRR